MRAIAIDPGTTRSAIVEWDGSKLWHRGIYPNEEMVFLLQKWLVVPNDMLVIEEISSYGMRVGKEVFETCKWSGRFDATWKGPFVYVPRREVKLRLCGTIKAKDADINQYLKDRFGGKGTKANPGLMYGVVKDMIQAFALAVAWMDEQEEIEKHFTALKKPKNNPK